MKSHITKNASENGGGETARRNGELLIADDFLIARLGLGTCPVNPMMMMITLAEVEKNLSPPNAS